MMKRLFFCILILTLLLFRVSGAAADTGQSVVVTGFGNTVEQALERALSEAVAAVAGALFAERSTLSGEDLKEQLLRYSRGTVKTYTVLEEKTLEKGFSVTVQAVVNSATIQEKMDEFIENFRADVSSPRDSVKKVQKVVDLLVEQLRSYRYEDFLAPEIVSVKRDDKTRTLTLALRIAFDKELYRDRFAWGVSLLLERIVAEPEFPELLFPKENENKRFPAATFHMLDENEVARSYILPVEIAGRLADALGFSAKSEPKGAAFRGAWLHIDLLDEDGVQLERIPVALPLTNVGAFLLKKSSETTVERVAGQLAAAEKRSAPARSSDEVFFVQAFGRALSNGNADFLVDVVQQVAFDLPEELYSRTKSVSATLRFEKW